MIITPEHAEDITPELAAEKLQRNKVNRPLRQSKVTDYAKRMERGEWLLNGATFTEDSDGFVVDGQHRYAAVVQSGVTIKGFIITGLSPNVRPTVDGGLMRIFGDDLTIMGVTDAYHKGGILRKAVLWDRTRGLATLGKESVTRSILAEQWPKYESAIEEAAPAKRFATGSPLSTGGASFAWWALRRYDSDAEIVERFFDIIRDGSQDPDDRVLVRLRKFLETPRYSRTGRRQNVPMKHEIWHTLAAWNGWVSPGEPVSFKLDGVGVEDPYPKPLRAQKGEDA